MNDDYTENGNTPEDPKEQRAESSVYSYNYREMKNSATSDGDYDARRDEVHHTESTGQTGARGYGSQTGGFDTQGYGSQTGGSGAREYGGSDRSYGAYYDDGAREYGPQGYGNADGGYGPRDPDGSNRYSYYAGPDHTRSDYSEYGQQGPQRTYKNRRQRKKPGKAIVKFFSTKGNFGINIVKAAVIAVVFGVIAGGIIYAINPAEETASTTDAAVTHSDSTEVTSTGSFSTATDVSGVVENVMPSIVSITTVTMTEYYDFFGESQSYEGEGSGSGIIVADDNDYLYIATNNHVVEDASSLTVGFSDETTAEGTVKGTSSAADLAVVTIAKEDLEAETLDIVKVASLGDSTELKVGEQAIAIGNALGYGQSVTVGYISAVDRQVMIEDTDGSTTTSTLIQTDAAINPGNSGGALLNINGEVIGINSVKYSDTSVEGMGYAIPISTASPIIDKLIQREAVSEDEQAYLGVSGVAVDSTAASTYNMPQGLYLTQVAKGSAAEQAGLQEGDIITAFDGQTITSMEELQSEIQYFAAGEDVEIVYERLDDGVYAEQTVTVTLGKKS